MKYEIHVPVEQYGFIAAEIEGEPQDAVEAYQSLKTAFLGATGISMREFCIFLESYVSTGKPASNGLSLWQDMSDEQKKVVNEFKKLLNRSKNK